jgi:hypothetical protein
MGFPPGSVDALLALNIWDTSVVAFGSRLAALDVAALGTLAVVGAHVPRECMAQRGSPSLAVVWLRTGAPLFPGAYNHATSCSP